MIYATYCVSKIYSDIKVKIFDLETLPRGYVSRLPRGYVSRITINHTFFRIIATNG